MAALCLSVASAGVDDAFVVGAVISADNVLYRDALKGLRQGLLNGTSREISVVPVVLGEDDQLTNPHGAASRLERADAIVMIGTRATDWALANDLERPQLSILMPAASVVRRKAELSENQARRTAFLVIDQPLDRQIRLSRIVSPEADSLGVLLGPSTRKLIPQLSESAERPGFNLNTVLVSSDKEANRAMSNLARTSDILLAVYDPDAVNRNTIRAMLYAAYSWRRPTIGFSEAFTRAGGLAAVYSRPEDIGREAGELIGRMAEGQHAEWGRLMFPKYFSVAVNRSVARSLDLKLPSDSELKRALED